MEQENDQMTQTSKTSIQILPIFRNFVKISFAKTYAKATA